MARRVLVVALALAIALVPIAARADCVQASQTAITIAQALNTYSIMRYTATGDPYYDQGMKWCGASLVREPLCNAAVNLGVRELDSVAVAVSPRSKGLVCAANYVGAALFTYYIRHAISVQVLRLKL